MEFKYDAGMLCTQNRLDDYIHVNKYILRIYMYRIFSIKCLGVYFQKSTRACPKKEKEERKIRSFWDSNPSQLGFMFAILGPLTTGLPSLNLVTHGNR